MSATRLYYYTDHCGNSGWFADAAAFRKEFPESISVRRVCNHGVTPPNGASFNRAWTR